MHRYKVIVSYDGSAYGGWQVQLNTHSIQEEIENALFKMHAYHITITASGRTDAHVHAIGQVFHFDSDKEIASENWKRALNALLPKDTRIQSVMEVSMCFHARFDAIGKRYDYLITNDIDNPFFQRYMGKDTKLLDTTYMQACAEVFIGTHDFTSFTSNKINPKKSRMKTITRIEVCQEDTYVRIIFEGSGFLRYMVRMLAQTLIEAGKHRLEKRDIQKMLDGKNKHLCRYKATAEGLYLVKVYYDEDALCNTSKK